MKPTKILYKYISKERDTILEKQMIRFTPPTEFNDPLEFLPEVDENDIDRLNRTTPDDLYKIFNKQLEKYGSLLFDNIEDIKSNILISTARIEELRDILNSKSKLSLIASLRKQISQHLGVLALSEVPDHPLLWAHYTENYQGYVIGFDIEKLWTAREKTNTPNLLGPFQVQYSEKKPKTSIFDYEPTAWFAAKQNIWSYEKEQRYVARLDSADEICGNNGTIHLLRFSKDSVAEVIFGLNTPRDVKVKIKKQLEKYSNVKEENIVMLEDSTFHIGIRKATG